MSSDYAKLIKYARLKENVSQELLAKKLGTTKSNISRIENNKQNLIVDDLERALNYLGLKIKIVDEKGEDMMKKMENELLKKELKLTDVGYSKDFVGKEGNTIRVEFNLLGGNILVAKDMFNKERYLSTEEYEQYEENYSDEEGYGEFYELYIEDFANDMWDIIGSDTRESNDIIISDKAKSLFDESTLKEIQEMYIELDK